MGLLIEPSQCTLLIIDLQLRLLPAIEGGDQVVQNAAKLLQCANLLSINACLTEQLPERLGQTTDELIQHLRGPCFEKSAFGAARDQRLLDELNPRREVVIVGTETHVCVLQTALQLLEQGLSVRVVSDACGSRTQENKQAGLNRMQQAGASLVTTEMVIFEWLGDAEHAKFRDALALIK